MTTSNREIAFNLIAWAIDELAVGNDDPADRIDAEVQRLQDVGSNPRTANLRPSSSAPKAAPTGSSPREERR